MCVTVVLTVTALLYSLTLPLAVAEALALPVVHK